MTRTVPEWIGKTDDEAVPPRVRLRVYRKDEGRCKGCGRKLRVGEPFITDHITALINGGENRESNLQTLGAKCCNPAKTAADVAEKAAIDHTAKSHLGIKKRTGFRGWRKFNGEIVFRSGK